MTVWYAGAYAPAYLYLEAILYNYDLEIDGRIMLKLTLNKYDIKRLICFVISFSDGR